MRKHHFSLGGALSALALFLILSASARAAGPSSCLPDCFADTFSVARHDVIELPGGCLVRVTWAKRFACGMFHDVSIQKVEPLNDSCQGRTLTQLLSRTTIALLEKNPMGFPPNGTGKDTCVTNWRVIKGSCWQYLVECGDTVAKPCDSTSCCLRGYEVCIDSSGKRTVFPRGGGGGGGACDTLSGCIPVCGAAGGVVAPDEEPEISSVHTPATRSRVEAVLPRKFAFER